MKFARMYVLEALISVIYCASMLPGTAHAEAARPPKPQTWVYDYDYQLNVFSYLEPKARAAQAEGKSLYIYLYRNNAHCEHVRRLMDRPDMRHATEGAQIVMLNQDRMASLYEQNPELNMGVPTFGPLIVRIDHQGGLTDQIIFPDVYLYHPAKIPEARMRDRILSVQSNAVLVSHWSLQESGILDNVHDKGLGAPLQSKYFLKAVKTFFGAH